MNTTTTMSATMQATVCNVERNQLLVCDPCDSRSRGPYGPSLLLPCGRLHLYPLQRHYDGEHSPRSAPTVSMSFAGAAAGTNGLNQP